MRNRKNLIFAILGSNFCKSAYHYRGEEVQPFKSGMSFGGWREADVLISDSTLSSTKGCPLWYCFMTSIFGRSTLKTSKGAFGTNIH